PDRERARPPRAPAVPGRASRRRRAGGVPAPAPRLHDPAAPRAVHAGLPRRPPDARRVPDVRGRPAGARAGPGLTAPADPPTRRNLMTAPVRDLDAPVVEVRDLRKSYGDVIALDGLDLEIGRGEVHGFLGPNGAGKSTTIRTLLGLLRHDGGTARVLGGDPWTDAVALHRRLAYVPGDVELWPNLTGGEAMDLLARLRGGTDAARRDELCERFDLDPRKKGRTYSKGNRQKVALVAALASDVELLLLDEPTAGLDPLMEAVFQECIREARAAGRT